jgi:hypothetical protein
MDIVDIELAAVYSAKIGAWNALLSEMVETNMTGGSSIVEKDITALGVKCLKVFKKCKNREFDDPEKLFKYLNAERTFWTVDWQWGDTSDPDNIDWNVCQQHFKSKELAEKWKKEIREFPNIRDIYICEHSSESIIGDEKHFYKALTKIKSNDSCDFIVI